MNTAYQIYKNLKGDKLTNEYPEWEDCGKICEIMFLAGKQSKIPLNGLTKEQLIHIGDLLGYTPQAAQGKAGRFLSGMQGKLKHWDYEEVINFGEMHKVLSVIKYLQTL